MKQEGLRTTDLRNGGGIPKDTRSRLDLCDIFCFPFDKLRAGCFNVIEKMQVHIKPSIMPTKGIITINISSRPTLI